MRASAAFAACVLLVLCLAAAGHSQVRVPNTHEVWFTPNLDSPDMLSLFTQPGRWTHARAVVSVFKFYQLSLLDTVTGPGPNTYAALRNADAFRKLTQWHKRIAIEAGAVKPFWCTPDASGMRQSILATLRSISNVVEAGGAVSAIAMDEPFISGVTTPACGGPDVAPTIERLRQYVGMVRALEPRVAIGLIEPYPFFSVSQLEQYLGLMRDAGILPAFFQIDVDFHALSLKPHDFAGDMKHLQAFCDVEGVPFGYIFWGQNVDSDASYAEEVFGKVRLIKSIFGPFDRLPNQLIFQSFARSTDGLGTVPLNLPETDPDSHTGLLDRSLALLHGYATSGSAVPRR